jgi:hypothetical protein
MISLIFIQFISMNQLYFFPLILCFLVICNSLESYEKNKKVYISIFANTPLGVELYNFLNLKKNVKGLEIFLAILLDPIK